MEQTNEPSATVHSERFECPADGAPIRGTVWLPEKAPRGVILVHPATATPERFYRAFAEYVTSRGLAAVTYDYRGTGASGDPKKLAGLRMRDWMAVDVPAIAAWARERFPDLPIGATGHSIGGHAMVLGNGIEGADRFAIVSSHVAATRQIESRAERIRVAAVLHVVAPIVSRIVGYMPGKRLGLGEDVPKAAVLEWGRWVRKPNYFFDDPTLGAAAGASGVHAKVLAIGSSDDQWASPAQMDALTDRLTHADVERRTYTPAELGVTRIEHHGLMRRSVGEPVWPTLIDWLTGAWPGS